MYVNVGEQDRVVKHVWNDYIEHMDNDTTFQMRCRQDWLEAIDAWRAAQRPIPSRAEAIRQLVDQALTLNARLPELVDKGAEVQALLAKGDKPDN